MCAAEYYVSNSGNDKNSGNSSSNPWNTIAKINNYSFKPGDVIYLNKGDTWREQLIPVSGNANGYITYSSYGTGKKPQLLGSISKKNSADWKMEKNKIWVVYDSKKKMPFRITVDVGNVIFNSGQTCGFKVFKESDLKKQNDYWYDESKKILKVYSEKNPAEMYSEIECALSKHIIDQDNRFYIAYDGLELKYGGAHGIGGENTHHIRITNCDVNYIGGGKFIDNGEINRYGNGIEFWSAAHDILVEGNNIWEIYDAALTNQGSDGGIGQYNIIYRNNTIWNAQWSFELWYQNTTAALKDIYFEKNTCKNAGYGWGRNQRKDTDGGRHLCLFSSTAQASNIFIRNNIFENAKETSFWLSKKWNNRENLTLDNNKYIQAMNKYFAYISGKYYLASEFAKYQTDTGKDANSIIM